MKVLIACEESQRVCIAFRERGHDPRRGFCPVCRNESSSDFSYCGNCGQRLDWRVKNETD